MSSSSPVKSITIYGFGPSFDPVRVDPSPAVLKLLSFLSYNKIDYKLNASMKPSPVAGRFPWAIFEYTTTTIHDKKKEVVEDSKSIIEKVCKLYNIDCPDAHLTKDQKIQSDALILAIDNAMYPTVVRTLWVDNPEWVRVNYRFPMPDFLFRLMFSKIRQSQINFLNTHGNGDMSTEESQQVQAKMYREIGRVLGDKKFLFSNDKPSLIDFVLARYTDRVWEHSWLPECVKDVFLKEYPTLVAYGKRLKDTFFGDEEFTQRVEEGKKEES